MADWLTEHVRKTKETVIFDEAVRPAPWEGRTRAQLIYGREFNDQPVVRFGDRPLVSWLREEDGTHTLGPKRPEYTLMSSDGDSTAPAPSSGASPAQPGGQGSDDASAQPTSPQGGAQSVSGGAAQGGEPGVAGGNTLPSAAQAAPAGGQPEMGTPPRSGPPSVNAQTAPTAGAIPTAPAAATPSRVPADARQIVKESTGRDAGTITIENDENNGRVLDVPIDKTLAGLAEAYVNDTGNTININSTVRNLDNDKKSSTHFDGYGMDINKINGKAVAKGEPLVDQLVQYMSNRKEAIQIFSPNDSFIRINGSLSPRPEISITHDDHIHLGTRLPKK